MRNLFLIGKLKGKRLDILFIKDLSKVEDRLLEYLTSLEDNPDYRRTQ